ncbi:hypothetical protein AMTR_s00010p00114440 [Amborella trichopoda]|uniref:Uncharacterized protein n=1 Tax=Amborella trichopoda TaxID=13333 RepID=W1NFY6_AMBTC|nr:hypothetical protein AMTR_s00010p00114440 [Amborella trichopoda]
MAESVSDPHNTMRARDVYSVAEGKQAPRPVRELGTISQAPAGPGIRFSLSFSKNMHIVWI